MRDIEAAGGVALTMDVTDDDTMIVAINRMISEQSRIDVLINNAGCGHMGALEDVPIEEGRRQMEVNLVGAARLTNSPSLICAPRSRGKSSTFRL
jgi:NAD(P)-dependent dehydrogenase (short-subunit alcohol dehydrogenase family)